MRVSCVIPTRGRVDRLEVCLASIRGQRLPEAPEIIVVEDAADPPVGWLGADVRRIRFESPVGACVARNRAVAEATGDLLLLCDDDAELIDSETIRKAAAWFERRPGLAAVAFRQLGSEREDHYFQAARSEVACLCGMFFSFACMVRRSAWETVGGMNEQFGYYFEEIELSLKFHVAGYEILYDPGIAAVHHEDKRDRDWGRIHRQTTRNALLTYLVHYPGYVLPLFFYRRLRMYARLMNRRFFPAGGDLRWLWRELRSRRGYVRRARRPMPWKQVRAWHGLCNRPVPLVVGSKAEDVG